MLLWTSGDVALESALSPFVHVHGAMSKGRIRISGVAAIVERQVNATDMSRFTDNKACNAS